MPEKNLLSELNRFHPRDPISALTHFIWFLAAIPATPVLLLSAMTRGAGITELFALSIFMISMVLLYGASAAYHAFQLSPRGNRFLKKLDHIMIFFLIAGSYTPICLIALHGLTGKLLLVAIWSLAGAGTVFALCWITCPKWVSSVVYIAMGWSCLAVMPQVLAALSTSAAAMLFAGGAMYTAGGLIYALKPRSLRHKKFGVHECFHLFVMAGTLFHYLCMLRIV